MPRSFRWQPPSLGKTQRFKTIQATTNPIITKTSDMVFFRSNPLYLALDSDRIHLSLLFDHIIDRL